MSLSSLSKRIVILVFCRTMNYAGLFLSPFFLVRILDVHTYGQYREFCVYAVLLIGFIRMSIPRSLLYFIPRSTHDEGKYITNAALLSLISWSIAMILVLSVKAFILARTSYDFIAPLIAYSFFYVNLDFIEPYWLARKRSDYVLYYSSLRVVLRLIVILVAAYYYRNVDAIIRVAIAFEAGKFVLSAYLLASRRLFTLRIDSGVIKEQLAFTVPLGLASIIFLFNQQLSKLVISSKLGVEDLAIYAIGSIQVPLVSIVRGAISDVIFPEMSERSICNPLQGLQLWKKTNVIYCFLIFPVFVVFFWYAGFIMRTLFTSQYNSAAPVFQMHLFLLIRQCFEVGSALRVMNQNKHFITGNTISLMLNIALLFPLLRYFGIIGPALAFVLSDLFLCLYIAKKLLKLYAIGISNLFMWRKVFAISVGCLAGVPVLVLAEFIPIHDVVRAVCASILYFVAYFVFVRNYRIEEIELIVAKLARVSRKALGHMSEKAF